MGINLEQLSLAPVMVEYESDASPDGQFGEWWNAGSGKFSRKEDAEFFAMARNAFDVMMRRAWGVVPSNVGACAHRAPAPGWGWMVVDHNDRMIGSTVYSDPFTALVEADRWYAEHVENGVSLPHAGSGGRP